MALCYWLSSVYPAAILVLWNVWWTRKLAKEVGFGMNKLEVFDLPEPFTVANAASSFKITTIYVRGQELELAEVICGHLRPLWLASTFCATVALDW